jgi:SAM-dependent methyltransferase
MDRLLERPPAEFDDYAADYDGGIGQPLKKCLGGDAVSFVAVKAEWLLGSMRRRWGLDPARKDIQLLDYGCGVGTLLGVLRRQGYAGGLAGCDVSTAMLAEAQRRWSSGPPPQLSVIEDGRVPWGSQFDLVVASAVLHHVEPSLRPAVYRDLLRLVKRGGCVCVFEHNPLNLVTGWVVRHTAIDKNAILLRPAEVRASLAEAGATRLGTEYLIFFPPRWRFFRTLERGLSWSPLGAQYVVCATR